MTRVHASTRITGAGEGAEVLAEGSGNVVPFLRQGRHARHRVELVRPRHCVADGIAALWGVTAVVRPVS